MKKKILTISISIILALILFIFNAEETSAEVSDDELATLTVEELKEKSQEKKEFNLLIVKDFLFDSRSKESFFMPAVNSMIIENEEDILKYETEIARREESEKWKQRSMEYPAATEIWLYMKSLEWNDYVCAGILGNMMAESGGQTLNIYCNIYNRYGYYGICQWHPEYYSEVIGESLQGQCLFLANNIEFEIDTFGYLYRKDFDFKQFLRIEDEREAAAAFALCYERCGEAEYGYRQDNASAAYLYFTE